MKEERLKILETCLGAIQDAHDVLEEIRDEEEEAYDNFRKVFNVVNVAI